MAILKTISSLSGKRKYNVVLQEIDIERLLKGVELRFDPLIITYEPKGKTGKEIKNGS
uniref:Uncharacterized protein n=1 Tax=viral metagenome TaxID=1070528 RepID=A0A6M3L0G8_9ZZZZ